ncbi:bifunctional lysylphosphatidylglycerol flippase/synthetase MprF [uncultured Cellulomonas sp.]|uniref:bifunctional lysylphosphatidylglycerol flippase/synthetase MprF n=1 Tax=uncultured Cellulomonas sp. TaxID=189682 RepID=UPI00263075F3|nr:bifunctional lysylphosphatidylglycerol flippase/synthetase MprF [uncultured Cellulomonas sp.]
METTTAPLTPPHPRRGPTWRTLRRALAPVLVTGVLAVAIGQLHRTLDGYRWSQLPGDVAGIGAPALALAVVATAVSYGAMTGYDALALRYVDHRLPYRRYAAASFVATAFGNSTGASAVVGAMLRARVYSAWQVPAFAITRIVAFNLVTLGLGFAALSAVGLLAAPGRAADALRIGPAAAVVVGAGLLAAVVGYVAWARRGGRALHWRDWRIDRPTRPLAVAQVLLSTAEVATMAAALWFLLPVGWDVPFVPFTAAFALATLLGLLSNVPGGIGVFEAALLVLLAGAIDPLVLAPALVAFRLVYYVLPLLLAAVVLVTLEARRGRDATTGSPRSELVQRTGVLTPWVLAVVVAGAGAALVVTGEIPGLTHRLPVHSGPTLGLLGVGLVLLALGLRRRLHEAWLGTVVVLVLLTALCLLLDARITGLVSLGLLALMVPAAPVFDRRSHVFHHSRGWTWSAVAAGTGTTAVAWLALHAAADGSSTWWGLVVDGAHPVSARLVALVGLAGVLLAGARLLAPVVPGPATGDERDLARAEDVVRRFGRATAHLAFTGDKRLLFSAGGDAFLMYGVEGRSWVSMGDPVGDPAQFRELLTAFVERAERHDGRPVLYGVGDALVPTYRELGLGLSKLGEEALIDLGTFGLEGRDRAKMRRWRSINERAGCSVEVLPPEAVRPLLPELRAVSQEWLAGRRASEKRFSLGPFDEDYVVRFPLAVVRLEGRIIAFATLWVGDGEGEVAIDLMRQVRTDVPNVMNYLFVEVMLWAKERGYATFSLGMAPLSGLCTDATAPFWDRIGRLVFTHGDAFYNFRGVRHFKECFHPRWEERWVAAPPGLAFPTTMLNVATLIGGGMRGVSAGLRTADAAVVRQLWQVAGAQARRRVWANLPGTRAGTVPAPRSEAATGAEVPADQAA